MPGRTTAAGLGRPHQAKRAAALAALTPGSPCPRCGYGMWPTRAAALAAGVPAWLGSLDLDHLVPRIIGGAGGPTALTHSRCNRAAGARITNRIRRTRRQITRGGRW